MSDTRIQTRLPQRTYDWLEGRKRLMLGGTASEQARTELEIWHTALEVELRRIRLTLDQVNCLADVLNGTLMSPGIAGSVPVAYAEASDAFTLARTDHLGDHAYGEKWGIDEEKLLGYLRTLGPVADHALHDAIARWWAHNQEPTAEGWASVGLRVVEDAPARVNDGGQAEKEAG